MINSKRVWAKPIRYNKFETIYDGQKIISKNAIINNWSYVIKLRVAGSGQIHYGLSKSALTAVKWKPKTLKESETFTREVHLIHRDSQDEGSDKPVHEAQEDFEFQNWYDPRVTPPTIGKLVIVRRHHPDFGLWEEISAWSGRVFLCDMYGCSKVLQWRDRTALD